MPRKHDKLFEKITNFTALHTASRRALKGKRYKPGAAAFQANLELELIRLESELNQETYRPGKYVEIRIKDPKPRMVSAAPFRDRVVHHAICAIMEPLFERGFIHHSYANRKGKGTHKAIAAYERYRDRSAYVLRADIYRYFPAIDYECLKADFRRRIACAQTLRLLDTIVDGSNPQEAVYDHYPGDSLFTPYERRRGLPIGNLTSQFFANLYLNPLDHFVTERLSLPYLRYVDDFALFHDDPEVLNDGQRKIATFLERRRIRLHPRKTFIASTHEPAQFLGFELLASGQRRLPEAAVRRFRNRLRGLRDQYKAGVVGEIEVRQRVGAWIAHAEHAQTWCLRRAIFRDGWFDPFVSEA